jgi:hypothetical protein
VLVTRARSRRPPRRARDSCLGRHYLRCSDAAPEPVGVDDQPAIMRDGECARPDLADATVDLDLGDDRDDGTRASGVGDATSHQRIAGAVGARRRARLPLDTLGGRLDDGVVARCGQITQAERDRVGAHAGCDFVDKDSLANWICGPTGSRRCAVRNGEARSSRVPPSPRPGVC